MADLYRTQILLERRQHQDLSELAKAEGRSMSEMVREAVAEYLVERNEAHKHQSWQEALAELAQIRQEIKGESGVYPGDLLAEIREERDEELERVMRGL